MTKNERLRLTLGTLAAISLIVSVCRCSPVASSVRKVDLQRKPETSHQSNSAKQVKSAVTCTGAPLIIDTYSFEQHWKAKIEKPELAEKVISLSKDDIGALLNWPHKMAFLAPGIDLHNGLVIMVVSLPQPEIDELYRRNVKTELAMTSDDTCSLSLPDSNDPEASAQLLENLMSVHIIVGGGTAVLPDFPNVLGDDDAAARGRTSGSCVW